MGEPGPKKTKNKPGFTLNLQPQASREETVAKNTTKVTAEILKGVSLKKEDLVEGELLGKGQYGIVRKVTDKNTGMEMAMKEIQMSDNDRGINEITKELAVLRKSDSPFIVKFYGSFMKDTNVYYCMELMDYGSLETLYKAGNGVPEPVLAKIAFATINGLKYMKDELHFIHRDIKPTNILVNARGEVKLCDFGISGELIQSVAQTYVGSSSYMAPERINPTQSDQAYDVRSDVWSLGITLVEVGNGKYPFPSEANIFAQLKQIVEGEAPKLNSNFSEKANQFVARCLAKERDRRPTYAQLLDDPWIEQFKKEEFDLAPYLETLKKKSSS